MVKGAYMKSGGEKKKKKVEDPGHYRVKQQKKSRESWP